MSRQPNFIFITTDQQRWDALGVHNRILRTPHMDRLANEGVRLERCYPTNAICMPARASMITGRSQRGHQVFNHDVNLSEAIPVLGDSLQDAGYATALIGKAHFRTADIEDLLPDRPSGAMAVREDGLWYGPYYGFEHAEIHTGHAYPAGHWRVWLERNHPEGLDLWRQDRALAPPTGAYRSWKNAIPADWHYTRWTADRSVEWLRQRQAQQQPQQQQPFFLWVSFADPHQPFAPPRPYCDMYPLEQMPEPVPREDVSAKPPHYQWAAAGRPYGGYDTSKGWDGDRMREITSHYYGLISFIDDALGLLFAELDAQGLWDDTHVVFTSDHGEGLNDHGIAAKPMMSYECVNRVPFAWRLPGAAQPRRYAGVMSHLDLTPTFLDLADAAALPGAEGSSFAATLADTAQQHRDAVIVERISVLGGEHTMKVKMLVTDEWKLLHYGSAPYGELYNVADDPEDLHNLWDDPAHRAVRDRLTDRLLAELIDTELGDPALILEPRPLGGALRDRRRMEPQPEARSELWQRLDGMRRRDPAG